MTGNTGFERALNEMEGRLNMKIAVETGKVHNALIQELIAHGIALRAVLEDFDEAQIEALKSRAVGIAATPSAKERVARLFTWGETSTKED